MANCGIVIWFQAFLFLTLLNIFLTNGLSIIDGFYRLEESDAAKQIFSILSKSANDKKGGIFSQLFKRSFVKRFAEGDIREIARHHIIPYQDLKTAAVESFETNPVGYTQNLEELINQEQISTVLDGIKFGAEDVGNVLHAALTWNKNNIVLGPEHQLRTCDLTNLIDEEILNQQTPAYQNVVRQFEQNFLEGNYEEAFNSFKNLETPNYVEWALEGDTYVATGIAEEGAGVAGEGAGIAEEGTSIAGEGVEIAEELLGIAEEIAPFLLPL